MRYLVILWGSALLVHFVQGADISGSYSAFPSSASESALMFQDLGGLIAGAENQTINARGQLKVVRIAQTDDRISVSVFDEAGIKVMNSTLPVFEQVRNGKEVVCVTRNWKLDKGGEGGRNSLGTLLLRMHLEQGRLFILAENTYIFPKFLWRRERRYVAAQSFVYEKKP